MVFSIDETTAKTVALRSAGEATYSTSSLPAGEHYILASYAGSSTYAPSGDGFNEIITPIKPIISPAGGTYTSQQTVTITGLAGSYQFHCGTSSTALTSTTAETPLSASLSFTTN